MKQQVRVLFICSMSLFMVGLDITAVNVALPSIGQQLDASLSWLQWTVSAYTVVMASLLLFSGSMADRLGRKRTLVIGLGVFSVASLLCSFAPTVELLVAFRVLQGVGASMLNPVAMSIITNTFTDPRERAQAVGVWGAVFGASMALGPIVGGALVSTAGWRWIFLMNIPLGLVAIALTLRFVPESRAAKARRFDPVGQALVIVLLAAVTYGIIEAPNAGWTAPQILAAFGAAALALLGLLRYEPRREEPLIDLRFFRSVPFSSSIGLAVAAFASFGGFLFLNTLYLQDVRGLSPVEAGIAIVPIALMTVVLSPISGRMVGRGGPRRPLAIAGIALVGRQLHARRHRRRTRRSPGSSPPTSSSGSASGSSTLRSPTPPCPACRASRRASPPRSRPPHGSSARPSAWRSSARSSPPAPGVRRSRLPPIPPGGPSRRWARSCSCSGWWRPAARATASARRTAVELPA